MSLSIRIYKKSECITFKSTKGRFGGLSNMAPGFPLSINGYNVKTSEALYQAFRYTEYPEIQNQILLFSSPISAKQYGRLHVEKTRSDWETNRFKIMKFCLELKLYQNLDSFSKVLLSTKNLPIVEYTEKDKVWGATEDGDYYIGTNALGRLLMELREKVINKTFEIKIPDINNFSLLGEEITLQGINSAPNIT